MRRFRILGFMRLVFVLFLAACGGSTMPAQDLATPLVGTLCTDARADPWQLPYTKHGAHYDVTLTAADYAPPIIGTNTWTLSITENGAPADVTLTATPWMPDHKHGTSVVPRVMKSGDSYVVADVYLFMAGLWQTTFAIDAGDAGDSDSVMLSYCLE